MTPNPTPGAVRHDVRDQPHQEPHGSRAAGPSRDGFLAQLSRAGRGAGDSLECNQIKKYSEGGTEGEVLYPYFFKTLPW